MMKYTLVIQDQPKGMLIQVEPAAENKDASVNEKMAAEIMIESMKAGMSLIQLLTGGNGTTLQCTRSAAVGLGLIKDS